MQNNYIGSLLSRYYEALAGITYNARPVNVYLVSVNADEDYHYIDVRVEGESNIRNKDQFVTNPTVIIDIVTVHSGGIDASVVEDIDSQVRGALFTSLTSSPVQDPAADFQISLVTFESANYLEEFDGAKHIHRKILRITNRLMQKQ